MADLFPSSSSGARRILDSYAFMATSPKMWTFAPRMNPQARHAHAKKPLRALTGRGSPPPPQANRTACPRL